MKTFNLNEYGVQEMTQEEMICVDGGISLNPWKIVFGWLLEEALLSTPQAMAASAQIKREGGTLCTDMPFK